MAGKNRGGRKKKSKSRKKAEKKQPEKEPEETPEESYSEEVVPEEQKELDEAEEDAGESKKEDTGRSNRLRIFLMLLVIAGLFIPISAYVEMNVASERNVREAVTSTAINVCEMEESNPAENCAKPRLSSTMFTEEYTYQDVIDDATNLIYYGGGRATDKLTQAQKNFVSIYRLKNFHGYSYYALFCAILALIGIVSLAALYRGRDVLAGTFMTVVNATLFLLFLLHTIIFIIWTGCVPRVMSALARSSGESLKVLVFGADFGFSLAKLHLVTAAVSLVLLIIIIIIRKARNRGV